VEPARPPVRRAAPRRARRPPLLGLDVPAAAGRRARDDHPRPRTPAPPGVDDRANALDALGEVPKRCRDVRRDLRELGVYGAGRGGDARRSGRADPRRAPRSQAGLPRRRGAGRPRLRVRPHGRDARAAQEPPGSGRRTAAPR
jgi:hypothetical protein